MRRPAAGRGAGLPQSRPMSQATRFQAPMKAEGSGISPLGPTRSCSLSGDCASRPPTERMRLRVARLEDGHDAGEVLRRDAGRVAVLVARLGLDGALDLGREELRLRARIAQLGRGAVVVVDVALRDLGALEAHAARRVVHVVVGGDALGGIRVAGRERGEELAALLGAVGGEVLVHRVGEQAGLERLGEVEALVGGELALARDQGVGEGLQVAGGAEIGGDGR